MSKEELLRRLKALHPNLDPEKNHRLADELLLDYIADEEISAAWDVIVKWYA